MITICGSKVIGQGHQLILDVNGRGQTFLSHFQSDLSLLCLSNSRWWVDKMREISAP